MKIIFIRHAKTAGNLKKRYIGRTDEPLCSEGIEELSGRRYPDCDILVSSSMKRCLETAKIIYPGKKAAVFKGFNECDFGDFEGKNYAELSEDPDYTSWIESGGNAPFPNGENPADFKKRCIAEFEKMIGIYSFSETISLVVHGGTIMSVLEKYAVPKAGYFDFQVENGGGYITEFDGKKLTITERI